MGKKATGGKKGQEESTGEDGPTLTGVFANDFPLLCERAGLPAVAVRSLTGTDDSSSCKVNSIQQLETSQHVCKVTGEGGGATLVPGYAALVEYGANQDLRGLHIRGWLLSGRVISVLKAALAASQLHTLNLWNVGLDSHTLPLIVQLVQQLCVRRLVLDGNPIPAETLAEVLQDKSSVEHLSLKCCQISDSFLSKLCKPLSDSRTLLALDLSCNSIGDEGVGFLASSLRLNRTLLSLSLTGNQIGDRGVDQLAEVVSRFPLSHEEVVLRRKLLSVLRRGEDGQLSVDVDHSRDPSPRGRSPSTVSLDKSGKASKLEKSAKGKKAEPKKEEKGKKEDKSKKSDSGKRAKGKDSRVGKKGPEPVVESPRPEGLEGSNPLLEGMEEEQGRLFLPGNTTLVHLALAHNRVTAAGMKSLLAALRVQQQYSHMGLGLLRITLQHNLAPQDCSELRQLLQLLQSRDPTQQTSMSQVSVTTQQ